MNDNTPRNSGRNYMTLVWGAFIGFVVSVLGNLIAGWIQGDIMKNTFTPIGLLAILLLSLLGLLAGAWIESGRQTSTQESSGAKGSLFGILRSLFIKSKLRSRGKGVKIDQVISLGSNFDIDTNKRSNED